MAGAYSQDQPVKESLWHEASQPDQPTQQIRHIFLTSINQENKNELRVIFAYRMLATARHTHILSCAGTPVRIRKQDKISSLKNNNEIGCEHTESFMIREASHK